MFRACHCKRLLDNGRLKTLPFFPASSGGIFSSKYIAKLQNKIIILLLCPCMHCSTRFVMISCIVASYATNKRILVFVVVFTLDASFTNFFCFASFFFFSFACRCWVVWVMRKHPNSLLGAVSLVWYGPHGNFGSLRVPKLTCPIPAMRKRLLFLKYTLHHDNWNCWRKNARTY